MSATAIFAPAKLNLFLAITGRRADGFHELVSVAAPVEFGDMLSVEATGEGSDFALTCDDATVPADETNLVLRAARAFRAASEWTGGARFSLEKRIPVGAGLGGGSSDAVAALRALNALAGEPLDAAALAAVAAQVGSDCPLFLHDAPVVMRGRGERIEPLAAGATRLRRRRVLIFKPGFGVPTPWAYARLAAEAPASYLPATEAEARLAEWSARRGAVAEDLLYNNMERAAFSKFIALPTLLAQLKAEFGLAARMSGSGSACFALLADDSPVAAIKTSIRRAWGEGVFVIETRIA